MLGTIVTPMARGQITLPKEMRDKLGIEPGTPLSVTLHEGSIVIKPVQTIIEEERQGGYFIEPTKTAKEVHEKPIPIQNSLNEYSGIFSDFPDTKAYRKSITFVRKRNKKMIMNFAKSNIK